MKSGPSAPAAMLLRNSDVSTRSPTSRCFRSAKKVRLSRVDGRVSMASRPFTVSSARPTRPVNSMLAPPPKRSSPPAPMAMPSTLFTRRKSEIRPTDSAPPRSCRLRASTPTSCCACRNTRRASSSLANSTSSGNESTMPPCQGYCRSCAGGARTNSVPTKLCESSPTLSL